MTLSYFNENNKSPDRINAETLHDALGDINLTEEEMKTLNWLRDSCPPSTVQNIVSAFKKAGQGQAMASMQRPINVGDILYIENSSGQWSEGRVLDKAIQSNTTHFYLQCPDKNKWVNESELGKTIFTPEQYRQKPSVLKEREDELHELFWAETNEEWTQEWRNSLTKDEQKLVDKWDGAYNKGVTSICGKILELEKPTPAPQMF